MPLDLSHLPRIIINGVALSPAQAMTVHVALQSFAMHLQASGLGEDAHGKTMTELYLSCIRGINDFMIPSSNSSTPT